MDVFLSYRRTDNEFLAGMVADRLRSELPDSRVFFDQAAIAPGADFRAVIDQHVNNCSTLVALIGPGWNTERLFDDEDFVRYELASAHARGRRIIPVLHSRRTMPTVGELPKDLEWLSYLHAITLGSYGDFGADIARLAEALHSSVPPLRDLRDQAWGHYERKEDDQALALVAEAWREHGHNPSSALADCCRTAAIVLTRQGRLDERNLWLVRAISVGTMSGSRNVVAMSMLPFFFQLSAAGRHEEARGVLDEIHRLAVDDPMQSPPITMIRRAYHEKRAWSLYETGDYIDALSEYAAAAEAAGHDRRGRCKVDGGSANCHFRLGDTEHAITVTAAVLAMSSENGWMDFVDIARHNLAVMRGAPDSLLPYEVT